MSRDDTVLSFILDTQIKLFEDARHELQLTLGEIAKQARLDVGTVNAWAQGRNALSLWGLKHLMRVEKLAPMLSRLFEPEEFALVRMVGGEDHDALCDRAADYVETKARAHRADSPAGVAIADCERHTLNTKATELRAVGQ